MPDVIDLPLDDDDPLYEPPLVDGFHKDPTSGEFVITFVPSDQVSDEPTEVIRVAPDTADYRRILSLTARIEQLLGGASLTRIVHGGGGNYVFHLAESAPIELADVADNMATQEISDRVKQIADTAELAFRGTVRS